MLKTMFMLLLILGMCHTKGFTNDLQGISDNCQKINKLEWVLGDWLASLDHQNKVITTESWHQISNQIWIGKGVTTKPDSNDKPFIEHLSIQKIGNEIFYIAKPPQNKFPTAFKLVQCSDSQLTFTNMTHDFPKVITYRKISDNQINVLVSDGEEKSFEIKFTKNGRLKTNQKKMTKSEIVNHYVDAYNKKDLNEMAKYLTLDIRWMSINGSEINLETNSRSELMVALKQHFSQANPSHSSLTNLFVNDVFVHTVEKATFLKNNEQTSVCSLSVYEFSNQNVNQDLIKNVWYFNSVKC